MRSESMYKILGALIPFFLFFLLLFNEHSAFYFEFWFEMIVAFFLMFGLCILGWGELMKKKRYYVCKKCGYKEVKERGKLPGYAEIGLLSAGVTVIATIVMVVTIIVSW